MQRARGRLIAIFAIALVLETIVGKEGVPKLRIFRFIGKGRPLSVWEISAFLKKEGILPSFHDFWDTLFFICSIDRLGIYKIAMQKVRKHRCPTERHITLQMAYAPKIPPGYRWIL